VSFEFMIDTACAARPLGVRNVMISNGYIRPKPLLELCGAHDAIKVDFKDSTRRITATSAAGSCSRCWRHWRRFIARGRGWSWWCW